MARWGKILHNVTRGHVFRVDRRRADPELRDNDEAIERKADIRAGDAKVRPEGQLAGLVPARGPGAAEADVAEADGAPGEDGGEARDG